MNVQTIVRRIRAYMREQGLSESALARQSRIPQSTIHRALKNPVRITRTHRALCKIAAVDFTALPVHQDAREELIREVLDIWDGSREHADSLARLLRAASALQAYTASQTPRYR